MIVQGAGVVDWVARRTGDDFGEKVAAIGQVKDDQLIAGIVYKDYNGRNVVTCMAIDAPPSREFWFAAFSHAFTALGCDRVTVTVEESNEKALGLNKHLGFTEESRMVGAASDGGDYIVMVMWARDCKQLNWNRHGQKRENTGSTGLHLVGKAASGH